MKSFFKFIFSNIHIKLLAVVIAAGVWVYAVNVGTQIGTVSAKIPVQIYNIPDSLALSNQISDIQIKVKAPQGVFQNLSAKDFTAFIDASDFTEGTQNLDVHVVSDAGVQILEKNPATVTLTLSKKTSSSFQVNVQTTGKLADGFGATGDPIVTPGQVTVSGAKDNVDKIAKVVALVTFSGEEKDVTQSAHLKALDKNGEEVKTLSFSPDAVQIKIPVERQNDTKTVGIKTNITGTPPSGFSVGNISTDRASVTISGKSSALSGIQFLETEDVNVASKTQTFTRTVNLKVPDGIQVQDNSQVSVTVEVTSVTKQKSLNAEVLFVGIGSGLKVVSKAPTTVTVVVSGSESVINALSDNDVKIQIDLQGKTTGTFNISLSNSNIRTPSNVKTQSFNPQSVSVTLGPSS
jgi:YbbR domain-containing protein